MTDPKITLYNLAHSEAAVTLTKARDAEIEYVRNRSAATLCTLWYGSDGYQTKYWLQLERETKVKMDDFQRQYDDLLGAMASLRLNRA